MMTISSPGAWWLFVIFGILWTGSAALLSIVLCLFFEAVRTPKPTNWSPK